MCLVLAEGVDEAVVAGAQKGQQGVAGLQPGGLVFHVEEVTGLLHALEAAVTHVLGELAGVGGAGVFIPFAVDEQQRDVDGAGKADAGTAVHVQYGFHVKAHLPVFVVVQGWPRGGG